LGTANFADPTPEEEAVRILERAVDTGINLIDTANVYAGGQSERFIGRWLSESGKRDRVILVSKAFYPAGPGPNDCGSSRLHILRACEDSLRRLQTDRIDFYLLHRPSPVTPIEETLGALDTLVRQGKVLYAGCSTYPAWRVMEALMVSEIKGWVRYVLEQPPYNLLDRRIENELLPLCQKYGLGVVAWSPLAMGVLSGRYADADTYPQDSRAALRGGIYAERVTARGIAVGKQFCQLAKDFALPPTQLAILWVKDQPGITAPLLGPRTVQQLEDLLPVAGMSLSRELREALDGLVPPGSAVANFHNSAAWMKMKIL
jgi:aryl-alcohol dehydrogenase-like predicted oxidoreductase